MFSRIMARHYSHKLRNPQVMSTSLADPAATCFCVIILVPDDSDVDRRGAPASEGMSPGSSMVAGDGALQCDRYPHPREGVVSLGL